MKIDAMNLPLRLGAVASMVSKGNMLVDVGCDHGFLSIYLVGKDHVSHAIASDVRSGPLNAAIDHVKQAGLGDRIETRLSDGLHNIIKEEITSNSSLVIAGMGGPLILRILSECMDVTRCFGEIIISPQSDIEGVRADLDDMGLSIVDEDMVFEDGKYYTIMKLKNTRDLTADEQGMLDSIYEQNIQDRSIFNIYGPFLIYHKHPVLNNYLDWQYSLLQKVYEGLDEEAHLSRREEIQTAITNNRIVKNLVSTN